MNTNDLKITLQSRNKQSTRTLSAWSLTNSSGLAFELGGMNSTGIEAKDAAVSVDAAEAVKLGLAILEAYAPERLVPEPAPKPGSFGATPVGTYLRNIGTGEVVQVIEWDDRFKDWERDLDNNLAAVNAEGRLIVPWDDGTDPKFHWEVVEAEKKTVFEVTG